MKVFICYHGADKKQKDRLIKSLKDNEISYYSAPEDGRFEGEYNETIWQNISKELDKCDCLICLVGRETYKRPHIDHELHYAFHKRKGVVALFIENRFDSINNLDMATVPDRLKDNRKYVVDSQFGTALNSITTLIDNAMNNSINNHIKINNSRHTMPLRQTRYQNN